MPTTDNGPFSDELIRRLPQRLQLTPDSLLFRKKLFWLLIPGIPLFIAVAAIVTKWPYGLASEVVVLFCIVLILHVFWLSMDRLIIPMLTAKGWLPNVEYIPSDNQMIIHDLSGMERLYNPEAEFVAYLPSIQGVLLVREPGGSWILSIQTKKGTPINIQSSRRSCLEEARTLGKSLSAMLSVPFSETPESSK